MRGIFAIDPGESTGVAWGIVDEKVPLAMAVKTVKMRVHSGSSTLVGEEAGQIRMLYRMWTQFKKHCVHVGQLDPEWVDLVVEDFVLFPGEKPGRSTTAPERIAWGFEGYRMACADLWRARGQPLPKHYGPIHWQKAGAAKRYSEQKILKSADAWIVGKQHERSAFAHMILRVNILLDYNIQTKG